MAQNRTNPYGHEGKIVVAGEDGWARGLFAEDSCSECGHAPIFVGVNDQDQPVTPSWCDECVQRNEDATNDHDRDQAPAELYVFTYDQLYNVLADTIDLAREYEQRHGHNPTDARIHAVTETLQGIDAQDELHRHGECPSTYTLRDTALIKQILETQCAT